MQETKFLLLSSKLRDAVEHLKFKSLELGGC